MVIAEITIENVSGRMSVIVASIKRLVDILCNIY